MDCDASFRQRNFHRNRLVCLYRSLLKVVVWPVSAALETLSKLYDNFGTYKTFSSLHFREFRSGSSVSIFTVPIPVPSSVCPSPSVTACLFDNSLKLTNCSRSLHMWLVAPESTIHFPLDTVEKA